MRKMSLHGYRNLISRLAVDMKFPIHIHIHRRLFFVLVAPKFSQNRVAQERPYPKENYISFWKSLKISKVQNKRTFALKYELS